jgi:endo-1,4-beta-xylanase
MVKKHASYPIIASLVIGVLMLSACKQTERGLKEVYKNSFYIGTALSRSQALGNDSAAIALVKKEFNTITSENDMKWEKIHPQPNGYDFAAADSFVSFGEKNNMFIIGHCLVWHAQTPKWVFEDENGNLTCRDTLLRRMHDHIFTVVGRYKGRVDGWDVVNEALADTGGLRHSKWFQIIGDDYIEKAFEFAYQADSTAELYYNDYSLPDKTKRESAVKLIKSLKEKGIKITAIGEQGHYTMDYPTAGALDSCIKAFSSTETKVMITEFDVSVLPFPSWKVIADISMNVEKKKELDPYTNGLPDSIDIKLASRYSELFQVFIDNKQSMSRVTFWGVNDGQSWKNYWPIFKRTDYPLLFDRNNQPKKAYEAVYKMGAAQEN